MQPGEAEFMGEDWQTQGDWVGRYGRTRAVLCAQKAPLDDYLGNDMYTLVHARLGPHHADKDSLRYWVAWPRTDNPKTLYSPILGYRRQSDWDDHGEVYPPTHEGPDVWVDVTVTAGVHRLSFYSFNKDGHEGANRQRDYLVEVKSGVDDPAAAPTLARARVSAFWGGVYHQFLVAGPGKVSVRFVRGGSLNTTLQGVMVDKVWGKLNSRDRRLQLWLGLEPFGPLDQACDRLVSAEDWRALAGRVPVLLASANDGYASRGGGGLQRPARVRLCRLGVDPLPLLAWSVPVWTPADRAAFPPAMKRGLASLQKCLAPGPLAARAAITKEALWNQDCAAPDGRYSR